MDTLSNARWERFSQALSEGKSATDAYAFAGYKPDRGNAVRLQQNDTIQQRVAVLLDKRASIQAQAVADAISKASLTKQWVIERLMENVARAMQLRFVTNDEGEVIGEFKYDGTVANRALELLGKEQGMFIDRKEVGDPGAFDRMSDDEILNEIKREAQTLTVKGNARSH